jgi:hypothetical protein
MNADLHRKEEELSGSHEAMKQTKDFPAFLIHYSFLGSWFPDSNPA